MYKELTRILLSHNIKLLRKSLNNYVPYTNIILLLERAIDMRYIDAVSTILPYMPKYYIRNTSILIYAVNNMNACSKIVRLILDSYKYNINYLDKNGDNALSLAINKDYCYYEIVYMLVDAGVNVIPKAFMNACKYGYMDVVTLLMRYGLESINMDVGECAIVVEPDNSKLLDTQDENGNTPLMIACNNNRIYILQNN